MNMLPVYDGEYLKRQTNRGALRRFIRKLYLNKAVSQLPGQCLDIGCGNGELLERLAAGSRGLEYNEAAVAFCQEKGLQVTFYDGYADNWALTPLSDIPPLTSVVLSHVLEHLQDPKHVLERLLASMPTHDICRILIIVPGIAGFRSDPTHLTFIDLAYLRSCIASNPQWKETKSYYFPINHQMAGQLFIYNELHLVLDKRVAALPD